MSLVWTLGWPSDHLLHFIVQMKKKDPSLCTICVDGEYHFCWLLFPLVSTTAEVDEKFRPEFGGPRCWYTQRYAMLIYFGVPVAISLLLNTFFFVTTSWNLRRAFKKSVNPSEDHHFGVYVRLFVIMGITWSFGFISAFTDEFVVDLIFVILNALQGLFLFLSFVCNRSVRAEIRKKRQKSREKKKMNLKQQPGTGSGTGSDTGSTALSGSGPSPPFLKKDHRASEVIT